MWSFTQRRSDLNVKQDDLLASKRFVIERKPDTTQFYELEEAIVLDIILDETHPEFKNGQLDPVDWPPNIDGTVPVTGAADYGIIGKIRFRFLNSEQGKVKQKLNWAYPIENTGISEYPLMNEVVIIGKYMNKYFYSKKLNTKQVLNSNADFITERINGYVDQNFDIYSGSNSPFSGPISTMNFSGGSNNYVGILGNYFKFNPNIRTLKRHEGDTILESRFGSSIRFSAYDDNRKNDVGAGGEYGPGTGNPMVLIRNGQSPIVLVQGYTAKGYTEEDVNKDGSSVHITSGLTNSPFLPTTKKEMFQANISEEQPNYSPSGSTTFTYPSLTGDQIVFNSDRLTFSSKANETFHFSKKRFSVVTDSEFTVDANEQIVMTTNDKAVINAPEIFLGAWGQSDEPALLGRTAAYWLYQMCNWMINQTDILISQANDWHAQHVHDLDSHKDTESPPLSSWVQKMKTYATQLQTQRAQLVQLRDTLPMLMSDRVFLTGGGGSPGFDGGELS